NGVTWLPPDTLSDVDSPLPLQSDPGIQATYAGDYDYGSAVLVKHATSWVDGRVPINGASQQDAFTYREMVGFSVTSTNHAFTCAFPYDVLLLRVVSTVPSVGGSFSPPAPSNYQYDVNSNEAVDPASVQTTDLMVSGNSGPSVTAVSVINGNMTARFTLHMNFGGALEASIAAGAITDQFGNPGAAFSGNYTVQGCPPQDHYNIAQIGCSIVPVTTDIGNHGDDV